jgi:predicted SnoaL-like aldol condensation-catalyzing enzyme
MVDGATEVDDLHKSDENKALVESFVTDVLIGGNADAGAAYFLNGELIQHAPHIGDGSAAWLENITAA